MTEFSKWPVLILTLGATLAPAQDRPPNVLLIVTDDQGYADIGYNGNNLVQTPVLDRLAGQSAMLDPFYAAPICTASRAALLTGRHASRAGVLDYGPGGRSMLYPEEWILPEALSHAGYATAIFGKWHLGDFAPMRPMDRGFQESLIIRAGMMGGEDALPGQLSYFDPLLIHNGVEKPYSGYCDDIYTAAAIDFIEKNRDKPFFLFLSTNLPHHPLTAPLEDEKFFTDQGLTNETARFYGMIRSVDRNIGKILARLDEWGLRDNTIIVFLGDNGTSSLLKERDRFEAGLRGRKTQVYEGGIRVPCLFSWPGHFPARRITQPTSIVDIMPTLLEVCKITPKPGIAFDGESLTPLLLGKDEGWPARLIFIEELKLSHSFAVRDDHYKLVSIGQSLPDGTKTEGPLELYDLSADPGEKQNIANQFPLVVQRLKDAQDHLSRTALAVPTDRPLPRIRLDAAHPAILTALDKRGRKSQQPDSGGWELQASEAGTYEVTLSLRKDIPIRQTGRAFLEINNTLTERSAETEEWEVLFRVQLSAGPVDLRARVELEGKPFPLESVTIKRL